MRCWHSELVAKYCAEHFAHGLGMELRHFEHAAELLKLYGAPDAFCVLAEDATALQVHLEAVLVEGDVLVYGLNGEAVKVIALIRVCAHCCQ